MKVIRDLITPYIYTSFCSTSSQTLGNITYQLQNKTHIQRNNPIPQTKTEHNRAASHTARYISQLGI